MLRDLLTQKSVDQKTVTDFRYPSKNVSDLFQDLKNVKIATKSLKICQFWPILANVDQF
jgi:hypothetical protein